MTEVHEQLTAKPARQIVTSCAVAKELVLLAICFGLAYPIAGFIYGLRDSDAGWAVNVDLFDGLASAVVMAIQTTTSLGFVSLGTVEDIGEGDMLNMYPSIFKCTVVLYLVVRSASLIIGAAFRRRRRRLSP